MMGKSLRWRHGWGDGRRQLGGQEDRDEDSEDDDMIPARRKKIASIMQGQLALVTWDNLNIRS